MGHKEAYACLSAGYDKEWKKHTPTRVNLNKQEDMAFVRARKQNLYAQRRALERNDLDLFYKILNNNKYPKASRDSAF